MTVIMGGYFGVWESRMETIAKVLEGEGYFFGMGKSFTAS